MTPEQANAIGRAVGNTIAVIAIILLVALVVFFLAALGGYLAHYLWDTMLWGWELAE